jgi:hypothetical protein
MTSLLHRPTFVRIRDIRNDQRIIPDQGELQTFIRGYAVGDIVLGLEPQH